MECTSVTHDSVPIGAIPILAGCSHDYKDIVSNVIRMANQVYKEFIKSDEGFGFNGRVYFIGIYDYFIFLNYIFFIVLFFRRFNGISNRI